VADKNGKGGRREEGKRSTAVSLICELIVSVYRGQSEDTPLSALAKGRGAQALFGFV